MLKDLREIILGLNQDEFNTISQLTFKIEKFDKTDYLIPFNLTNGKYTKYYYQPYRFKYSVHTPIQKDVLRKFKVLIEDARTIPINLNDGDALLLNNDYMLHGRTAYTDEKRLLKRFMLERKESFLHRYKEYAVNKR